MYGCRVCGLQCFMCLEHSSLSIVIQIRLFVHMTQSVDVEQVHNFRFLEALWWPSPDRAENAEKLKFAQKPPLCPTDFFHHLHPVPIWSIDMKKAILVVVVYHI